MQVQNEIPTFYHSPTHKRQHQHQPPLPTSPLGQKCHRLSQCQYLQKLRALVLSDELKSVVEDQIRANAEDPTERTDNTRIITLEELQKAREVVESEETDLSTSKRGTLLHQWNDLSDVLTGPKLSYGQFRHLRQTLPSQVQSVMTSQMFVKFPRDKRGRIDGLALMAYLDVRNEVLETFLSLSRHDPEGMGYLTESTLAAFIHEEVITSSVFNISPSFLPYYVQIATRKFVFRLDVRKSGRVWIKDVLVSSVLAEFLALSHSSQSPVEEAQPLRCWFRPSETEQVYRQFCQLDTDKNGRLSVAECLEFGTSSIDTRTTNACIHMGSTVGKTKAFRKCFGFRRSFTPIFVDRLFQVIDTPDHEMVRVSILKVEDLAGSVIFSHIHIPMNVGFQRICGLGPGGTILRFEIRLALFLESPGAGRPTAYPHAFFHSLVLTWYHDSCPVGLSGPVGGRPHE